jgi:signal transduction histidine kinase
MLPTTRTDEILISQLCEHQPEAIAWFIPVYDSHNGTTGVITDFEVRYCNIACAEKKGITREEVIGRRVLRDGFPDPTIKELKFAQCFSVFQTGEPIHYSYFSSYYEKYFMLSRVKLNEGILVTSRDLTPLYTVNQELKRFAEENHKLVQQFEKTINAAADGIITLESIRDDENEIIDFKITQCNEQGFRMGRLPGNAVGRTLLELLPQIKEVGYFDIHKKVVETGESFFAELPFSHDGSTKGWYILSLKKLDDGLVSNFIDTTYVREIERKAMENATELDAIFQTTLTAVYLGEAIRNAKNEVVDLKFLRVNKTFTFITGITEETLLNNSLLTISPVTKNTQFLQSLESVLSSGNPVQDTLYYPNIDRWFEFSMAKMDNDKVTVSFFEVTSLKRKEQELQQNLLALKRSNDNLEDFTRAASHDLKEPIRKISFFGAQLKTLLQRKENNEEELRLLERMDLATSRMRQLIDDLLSYSHVNVNGYEKEEIDLNDKLKLVLTDLELLIKEKNATITSGNLPTVLGYRRQFQQLFQNLISNSLKYSKSDEAPQITIKAKKLLGADTGMELPPAMLTKTFHLIELSDNGIGFDQVDAERIFNVFTRLHGNYEYSGTGVGLSIVRKVVENHDGFIAAHAKPGQGATFRILLPC